MLENSPEVKINKPTINRILRYYSQRPYLINSYDEFLKRLSVIPSYSRKVLEVKWGFNGDGFCYSERELARKLGVEDVHEQYQQAQQDLALAKYVIYLENPESLDFKTAIKIGKLARDYCKYINYLIVPKENNPQDLIGKINPQKLLECVNLLEPKYRDVLISYYGLCDNDSKTQASIANQKNISQSRVSQFLYSAFTMLECLNYRFSRIEVEYWCELKELIAINKCSKRIYLILRRNDISTIEQLKNLTENEIYSFRGVGIKILKEIMELKATL